MEKQKRIQAIQRIAKDEEPEIADRWMELARGGTAGEPERMAQICGRLKALFEEEGFRCSRLDAGGEAPPVLIGVRGNFRSAAPVIFSGHYDTVFRADEWDEPASVTDDGKICGPGVLDMKGGILAALLTARILRKLGRGNLPLKIVFVGDEEVGHEKGNAAELLKEQTTGGRYAFNMETGFLNNGVCIGRKGTAICRVEVLGRGAHPGNDFEKGRNAVVEMANKVAALSGLTDLERGLSVSVNRIGGGTVSNVIPDRCEAEIDLRFTSMTGFEKLKAQIAEICAKCWIEGTRTEVSYREMLPPFETTDQVMELYGKLKQAAEELSQPEISAYVRGGASDAAYISQTGTPVLCAVGVRGEGNHTRQEYAVAESLRQRSELLAYMIVTDQEAEV